MAETTEIIARDVLHKGFGTFETFVFRRRRRDGAMAELKREILDTGDGAAILPYDRARGTIILIRQFRGVAFLREGRESLVEACAGKIEGADPLTRIRKETEEETGLRLTTEPRRLFDGYSSPASFSERVTYFVAPYEAKDRISAGGRARQRGRGHRGARDDPRRSAGDGRERRDQRFQDTGAAVLGEGDRADGLTPVPRRRTTHAAEKRGDMKRAADAAAYSRPPWRVCATSLRMRAATAGSTGL